MKIKSVKMLEELREIYKKGLGVQKKQILICAGTGCVAGGSVTAGSVTGGSVTAGSVTGGNWGCVTGGK